MILLTPNQSQAESGGSIYAEPNINSNLQINGEGYINYDVKNVKGKELKSSFEIQNYYDRDVTVKIDVRNGLTNASGEIYDRAKQNDISGFLDNDYIMENYIKDLPDQIKLKKGEKKTVNFKINVPAEIKGKIIGGLGFRVAKKDSEDEKSKDNAEGSITINQEQGFVFAIWLNGDKVDNTEMHLNGLDVNDDMTSPVLYPIIENKYSDFVKDESLSYKVINKKNDEKMFEGEKDIEAISPKNYVKYPIEWEGEVKPGEYTFKINDESYDFELTKKTVNEMASNSQPKNTIVKTTVPFWVWILFAILLVIIVYLSIKIRKTKKQYQSVDSGAENENNETENDEDEFDIDDETNDDTGRSEDNTNKENNIDHNTDDTNK